MQKPRPHLSIDKWHLDEMVIKIKGQQYYLWRVMDKHKQVLDDKLPSYRAAKKKLLKGVEHRQHKGLNNRAKNSHRPTRVWEQRMGRFKSPGHAQRFLSAFEPIRGHFHPHQH